MNLVFSENTGEYLNKKSEKSIVSSSLNQIEETSESIYETNSIDKEIK
jgi:NAD(P)H-quinone oxidoreductase subunit K